MLNAKYGNYRCVPVYKCRMCGKTFAWDATRKTKGDVFNEFFSSAPHAEFPTQRETVHDHENASVGIADLIGFQRDGVTDDDELPELRSTVQTS